MSLACWRTHALVVLVLVVLIAVGGCSISGPDTGPDPEVVAARQSAGIADCPVTSGATAVLEDGLPELTLACLGGDTQVSLPGLAGEKPVVINVWATWCGPCRAEAPILAAVSADLVDQVQFVGIDHVDPNALGAVAFAQEAGWRYPQLADPDGDGAQALGVAGLPHTIFVAADGTIAYRHSGAFDSQDQLRDLISLHLGVG